MNLFNNKINIISLVLYINKQRGLINLFIKKISN